MESNLSGSEGERIRLAVQSELRSNKLLVDDNINVDVEGDEVILSGDVDTKDKKWLAQDIANSVFGVLHVHNSIEVVEDEYAPESTKRTEGERHYGIDAGLT